MSKSILLDSLNGDWVVHGEGTAKYWKRGNYKIIHSDNIFNTNKQGWIIKESQGLQILGLATSGDPWQPDAEMIWNPNAIYTEDNINNFQVIAITDKRVVDISNYYLCNEINYDENGKMVSWNGREVFLRKNENNELQIEYSSDIREGLLSEGLNVIVGDIYNFNATAQLFIYPEIGLDTSIIEKYAAQPENILIDKKAYVNGKLITGTMPTSIISSSSQQSNFIISSGYLENDYILPQVELKIDEDYPYRIKVDKDGYIQEQSIDVAISVPQIFNNKTTLSVGYLIKEITYITTTDFITADSCDILQNKISIDKEGNQLIGTIETVSPVKNETNKSIDINIGYLSSFYTHPDYSYTDVTQNDVLLNKSFINKDGVWKIGTIETIDDENIKPIIDEQNYTLTIPSGYLSEDYVHTIPVIQPDLNDDKTKIMISKGYINEEIQIPISVAIKNNNEIIVPAGYVLEKQTFDVNIDTTTNNPATASDILLGKIAFANNEKIVGEILTYEGQNQINPAIKDIILSTENKYIKSNITIKAVSSDIDENIQAKNIKKGTTILGVEGDLEEGVNITDSTAKAENVEKNLIAYGLKQDGTYGQIIGSLDLDNVNNISYGYINKTGFFQQIDLSSQEVIDKNSPVQMDNFYLFDLPSNIDNFIASDNQLFRLFIIKQINNNIATGCYIYDYSEQSWFYNADEFYEIDVTNNDVVVNKVYVVFKGKIINGAVG